MNENKIVVPDPSPVSEVTKPPGEVKLPAANAVFINIDDIKENSIVVINIDVKSPEQKMAVAPTFGKLLAPYAMDLRKKHITVMLMALDESIELVSEEDMNKAGWFKKEKSIIINPYEK